MNREGHLGLGFALFAPFGIVLASLAQFDMVLLGAVGTLFGAGLPDVDTKIKLFKHRGWTHTVYFVVLATAATAVGYFFGGEFVVSQLPPASALPFGISHAVVIGIFTGFGVVTHLLGDALTVQGIRPFQPLTPRGFLDPASVPSHRVVFGWFKSNDKLPNFLAVLGGVASAGLIIFVVQSGLTL